MNEQPASEAGVPSVALEGRLGAEQSRVERRGEERRGRGLGVD